MKDLKIEYRDGKLVELCVDGVTIDTATSIDLSHLMSHGQAPKFTLVMPVTPTRSLNTDDVHSKVALHDIKKQLGDEGLVEFGAHPVTSRMGGYQPMPLREGEPLPPPKKP